MLFMITFCLLLVVGITAPLAASPDSMPAAWRLDDVSSLRDNGLRGEVILNGFWQQQPDPTGGAALEDGKQVRMPGNHKSKASRRVARQFMLPEGWADRRITLYSESMDTQVYVNGKRVHEGGRWPYYEFGIPAGLLHADQPNTLELVGRQFNNDLWLRSYPQSSVTIDESYLQTSVKNKQITLDLNGKAAPGQKIKIDAQVTEHAGSNQVLVRMSDDQVKADDNGRWSVRLTAPLEGVKLWSHRDPNLYDYTVSVTAGNQKQDALLPRRTGFREVSIADGRFVVNGVPVLIIDDTWERGAGGNRKQAEQAMELIKSMGITGGFRVRSPVEFAVADEKGLLLMGGIGSLVRYNIWNPKSGLTSMGGDERMDDLERTVRALREHPSIIVWSSNAPYALASMHPRFAGQYFNSWDYFPLNRFSQTGRDGQNIFKKTREHIRGQIDPTREIATPNGPFSPVETATRYLCNDLDLQEREEFFDYWFRSGSDRKVVWPTEFSIPIPGHQFIRRIDFQLPQGNAWPRIHLENKARYFGPQVYHEESDEIFKNDYIRHRWTNNMLNASLQELNALNIERIWRAWRTYGVNASGHHILNEIAFGNRKKENASPEKRFGFKALEDPRVPGGSVVTSATYIPNPAIDDVPPAAETYNRITSPVLGYIGGPDTHFTNKDHNFFADQPVRKAYIVVNDLMQSVQIDATWELTDTEGNVVLTGELEGMVEPGQRALTEFPIEFTAPAVQQKTRYTLRVKHAEMLQAELDDAFQITVFPKYQTPQFPSDRQIWTVNISDDLTHERQHVIYNRDNQELLEQLGLDAKLVKGMRTFEYKGFTPGASLDFFKGRKLITEGTPKPGDLLIIPRQTLNTNNDGRQHTLRTLEKLGFDQLVEQGLRVLVLEQSGDNLMGINTERTRPRHAFIAAPGHPVFEGLDDTDLSNWTGASDLVTAISPLSVTENEFPERMFLVSNTNAVASRPLIRPQVGAVRTLAASGFDLQESPLIEVTRGKGRVIFCQFDVTNRYGKDPAATRLLENIVRYILTATEPDPEKNNIKVATAGQPGVTLMPHVFRAAVPESEAGWGILPGDLFNREAIYVENWVTRTLPEGELPVFKKSTGPHGYPSVIRWDQNQFQTTYDPSLFNTGWMKRKAAWVQNALVVNQGGSREQGPALQHHGRLTDLYPYEWVENFVHPYTFNIW